MKALKIGFVFDDSLDKPDGVQQYVLTLGRWFAAHGHEVHFLVGQTKRSDVKNVHSLSRNVAVRFNKNNMSIPLPADKRRVKRLLEHEQFDVLHVQVPYSPALAAKVIAAAPPHTAVIGTFHILPYARLHTYATKGLAVLLRPTLKRFDTIVAVSEPAAKFARRTFGVESPVVPNAVALDRFFSGSPLPELQDKRLNIVFLGRLVQRKGCMYLLKAVAALDPALREKVHVIIIGKGQLLPKLEQFVRQNNLEKVVEFAGFVPEETKPDYLASAHLAVFPSVSGESFGIVLVEAMAAGAQVVLGGNNPGYASVLQEVPHQLFDPQDTAAFAQTLTDYLRKPGLRRQASKWQKTAVLQYDVAIVGQTLLNVYRRALHHRS